jgi:hypothetical protein
MQQTISHTHTSIKFLTIDVVGFLLMFHGDVCSFVADQHVVHSVNALLYCSKLYKTEIPLKLVARRASPHSGF